MGYLNEIRYNSILFNEYSTAQHSTEQWSTVQYDTVRYNTVRTSAEYRSTIPFSFTENAIRPDGDNVHFPTINFSFISFLLLPDFFFILQETGCIEVFYIHFI